MPWVLLIEFNRSRRTLFITFWTEVELLSFKFMKLASDGHAARYWIVLTSSSFLKMLLKVKSKKSLQVLSP